jgi:SagB-type dehydrogenase family enzyme
LATRRIISPYFRPLVLHADDHHYRLSRFTYAHYEGGALLLESPRCHAQVRLHDWQGAALMAAWSGSEGSLPVVPAEVRRALERFVAEVGLLVAVDEAGETAETNDDVLRQWAFHDLLFHARVRQGRHNNPLGGIFPFRDDIPDTPSVKRPMSEEIVKLARPDLAEFGRREAPFTEILDGRRSLRVARERPLTLDELGTFLYRSARPLSLRDQPAVNRRPYPNAGGRYELELYILSHTCEGLAAGLYHYDAYQHGLEKLAVRAGQLRLILEQAAGAMGGAEKPAVLVLITARFQRVSWKYASIAYSLMLKNVGALYQTMYLTATAMGLHPCALGAGNSELFARVTGIPYEEEGTVGEFCLY